MNHLVRRLTLLSVCSLLLGFVWTSQDCIAAAFVVDCNLHGLGDETESEHRFVKDEKMHANAMLLKRLFAALNEHDHRSMAECYHRESSFSDIAFDLRGKTEIHAMWHMICEGDITAAFDLVCADDRVGQVSLVDDYTFTPTGRKVPTSSIHILFFE